MLVSPFYNILCALMMSWVTTIYPIYRTVKVLNKKETSLYINYLSFWFLAGLIFAFEWSCLHLLIYSVWFQLKMLTFMVLLWDSCTYSRLIYSLLTPLLDEHEDDINSAGNKLKMFSAQVKDGMYGQVTKHGPTVLATGQRFVGEMVLASAKPKGAQTSNPNTLKATTVADRNEEKKSAELNVKEDLLKSEEISLQDLRDFRAFKKMQQTASEGKDAVEDRSLSKAASK